MNKKLELLAPAGSIETLHVAAKAGADAVYVGGSRFGARAYANNLSQEELIDAMDFLHFHNKKMYLTINTLIKEIEIKKDLYNYLKKLYINGLDAVIVQDLGIFKFIRQYFPQLSIHCSTQMAIMGVDAAKFIENQGASRIVTAREISLEEIRHIKKRTNIEIESFCHGALCYCYSGQCLMSSVLGGRSGNRGRCAQPCRLPYKVYDNEKLINNNNENYVLSLKDMCMIENIPQMAEAGVYSFKIEGRMKRAEYCAIVVEIYRKYIDKYLSDDNYNLEDKDIKLLYEAGNRSGFSKGYYFKHNDKGMVTLGKPDYDKGSEYFFKEYKDKITETKFKEKIKGKVILRKEKPAIMQIEYHNYNCEELGQVVQTAKNQPLTEDKIRKQLNKTGNFEFEFEKLTIESDDDIFMPVKGLNDLRRYAVQSLQNIIKENHQRVLNNEEELIYGNNKNCINNNIKINVYIEKYEYLEEVLTFDEITSVYINYDIFKMNIDDIVNISILCKRNAKKVYYVMPYIFRYYTKELYSEKYRKTVFKSFDGIVVRNLDEYAWLNEYGYKGEIINDYILYTFNSFAYDFWREHNTTTITAPLELNERELKQMDNHNNEMIVYGYIPLMVSAQCLNNTMKKCNNSNCILSIKDRYKKDFLVRNFCDCCYSVIYNSSPLILADKADNIKSLGFKSVRLNFTNEEVKDIKPVLKHYINSFKDNNKKDEMFFKDFTRGHFTRGVE